jgi:hypothetical protein
MEGKRNISKRLAQAGMITSRVGDIIPVIIGGYSIYKHNFNQALKEGLSEAEARKLAETELGRTSDRSQQSGALKDLSEYEMGGSVMRLFTMFLTSPRQYFINSAESVADAWAGKKGSRKNLAKKSFIYLVVLPEIFQFTSDFMRHGFDSDEYEKEDYLLGWLTSTLSGAFFIGPMLEDIADAAIKGNWYSGGAVPISDLSKDAARTIKSISEGDIIQAADEGAELISTTRGGLYAPVKRETESWLKKSGIIDKSWTEIFTGKKSKKKKW